MGSITGLMVRIWVYLFGNSVPLGHRGIPRTPQRPQICTGVRHSGESDNFTCSRGTLKSLFHWLWVTCRVVTVFIYRSAAPGRKNVRAESSARPMKSWNMAKCSNPFVQSANSHIIIIKPPVEAVLLLLICKFFIQIPQIMSTKTSPSTVIHS